MRKLMVGVLVGFAVLAVTAIAFGDADWNLAGKGARALGMGGAFTAIADDATAVSWNPAGLAQLDKPEISGVFKLETLSVKMNPHNFKINGASYHWVDGPNQTHFVVNFASGALPLKVKQHNLTLALAYQQQLDFFFSNGDSTFHEVQKGGAYTLSPGLAFQVTPQLALGAAYNIWMNSSKYEYHNNLDPTKDYSYNEPYSGKNFFFGALAHIKPLRFGAVMRTPVNLTYHRDFSGPGNPYAPNTRRPVTGDWKQKIPLMYGFGMAVEPSSNFTISADLDFRPFSNMEVLDSTGTKDTTFHFQNCTQFRVGMEYLALVGKAILPFRLGWRNDPKTYTGWNYSIVGTTWTPRSDDQQTVGNVFTFGNGVAFRTFQLDEAFELGLTSQKHTFDATTGYDPSAQHRNFTSFRWLTSAIIHF